MLECMIHMGMKINTKFILYIILYILYINLFYIYCNI